MKQVFITSSGRCKFSFEFRLVRLSQRHSLAVPVDGDVDFIAQLTVKSLLDSLEPVPDRGYATRKHHRGR